LRIWPNSVLVERRTLSRRISGARRLVASTNAFNLATCRAKSRVFVAVSSLNFRVFNSASQSEPMVPQVTDAQLLTSVFAA
jgi:hypothetical protein